MVSSSHDCAFFVQPGEVRPAHEAVVFEDVAFEAAARRWRNTALSQMNPMARNGSM